VQTLPVNCNRCGTGVDVGSDTRYVTCTHCRTPLVVIRTGSSVFTDIAARQKELEQIDRKWEEEKQREYMWTDKNGGRRTCDEHLEPVIIITVIVAPVFLAAIPFSIVNRTIIPALCAIILGIPLVVLLAKTINWVRRYWRAEARYRARRSAVEQRSWIDYPS